MKDILVTQKIFYLYKIVNSVNDKVYIGITSKPEARFKQHLRKNSTCTKLKRAISKYGAEKFRMEILCIGTEEYILDLEVKAIQAFNSIQDGYNLILGNPKTGGVSLSQEVKDKVSEGLLRYYSGNESSLKGRKVQKRMDDAPIFVTGFWFPNRRTCLAKLTINSKSLDKWKAAGTLGNVQHLSKDAVVNLPTYVAGFWFDSYLRASEKLDQKISTLKKRVKQGFIEQKNNKTFKTGADNHMTKRVGALHHNSKAIEINGVVYGSIAEAVRETEYTKKMIYNRLKNSTPGFSWAKENRGND